MSGRIQAVTGYRRTELNLGWEVAASPADSIDSPAHPRFPSLPWQPTEATGTVAAILRANGAWSLDGPERNFDSEEWWYRVRFRKAGGQESGLAEFLGCEGLATAAEGWLNGTPILSSDNMFVSHEVPVGGLLRSENELVLRFRSLARLLEARRPRPRWRTPMVSDQRLNWFRTTLLGHTPGWSPPVAPVGPWRPVWLETRQSVHVGTPEIITRVIDGNATVSFACELRSMGAWTITEVVLLLSREDEVQSVVLQAASQNDFAGELTLSTVALWWPHTHGAPALYEARLEVRLAGPADAIPVGISLGHIGFRTVDVDTADGNFSVRVNGQPIFCRGACWTPPDCVTLHSDAGAVDTAIAQMVAAGMNMVRVGGTMVYESDAFLDACDRHGVLLWHDFMFANMDYPEGDAGFNRSVTLEATQFLSRLGGRPCITVLCGNSEGEQQAAMWGAPRERWKHALFHELLPELCKLRAPGVVYWPSSAHGGDFPHQTNAGTVSYYGVGAYLKPLTDARRADVRFATECLALANVPEEEILSTLSLRGVPPVHSPAWKARVPRDLGAGWDFEDVRDYYLREIFRVDPLAVRYGQHDRYLAISRVVSGEVMAAAFREWRRCGSTCGGALVWFLRDLWAGAGWGIVDASGSPKAPYYFLKRLLQPRTVFLTDEGGSGLCAHLVNERFERFEARLSISMYRDGRACTGTRTRDYVIEGRGKLEIPLTSLFEGFIDLNYAYRFGAPACEVICATLLDMSGAVAGCDYYFPLGQGAATEPDVGLSATVESLAGGDAEICIQTASFARYVSLQLSGFEAADQYFHLPPGVTHKVRLRRTDAHSKLKGEVRALNSATVCRFLLQPQA